jgi:hypothetical protein
MARICGRVYGCLLLGWVVVVRSVEEGSGEVVVEKRDAEEGIVERSRFGGRREVIFFFRWLLSVGCIPVWVSGLGDRGRRVIW